MQVVSLSSTRTENIAHKVLSQHEMLQGCKAGLDSWADSCCVGKHAFIREVIEGKLVNAHGFSNDLPSINDIPIVNCTFAYDDSDGKTFLLEFNNALYLGEKMEHALICPNQCEHNGTRIDLRPSYFYPNSPTASTVRFPNGLTIPIHHNGPLPYFNVRHPTKEELLLCEAIEVTSTYDWDPYSMDFNFSKLETCETNSTVSDNESEFGSCDISNSLLNADLYERLVSKSTVEYDFHNDKVRLVSAFATRRKDKLSPEDLVKLWRISLSTAQRTLNATTHQCLRSLEDIRRRF